MHNIEFLDYVMWFAYLMAVFARPLRKEDQNYTAWDFISGNKSNMYLLQRNFLTDIEQRENIVCTKATTISLNECNQTAFYTTVWYNSTAERMYQINSTYLTNGTALSATHIYGNVKDTDNYTFVYSDGRCAVTTVPDYNKEAEPWYVACELWVREGSTGENNEECQEAYKENCGPRIIVIYDASFCESLYEREAARAQG